MFKKTNIRRRRQRAPKDSTVSTNNFTMEKLIGRAESRQHGIENDANTSAVSVASPLAEPQKILPRYPPMRAENTLRPPSDNNKDIRLKC